MWVPVGNVFVGERTKVMAGRQCAPALAGSAARRVNDREFRYFCGGP